MNLTLHFKNKKTNLVEVLIIHIWDKDYHIFKQDEQALSYVCHQEVARHLQSYDYSGLVIRETKETDYMMVDIKDFCKQTFDKHGVSDTAITLVLSRARRNIQLHMDFFYDHLKRVADAKKQIQLYSETGMLTYSQEERIRQYPLTKKDLF